VHVAEHTQLVVLRLEVAERREQVHDEVEAGRPRELAHVAFDEFDGDPSLRRVHLGALERTPRTVHAGHATAQPGKRHGVPSGAAAQVEHVGP
jgi:hypothetical protein